MEGDGNRQRLGRVTLGRVEDRRSDHVGRALVDAGVAREAEVESQTGAGDGSRLHSERELECIVTGCGDVVRLDAQREQERPTNHLLPERDQIDRWQYLACPPQQRRVADRADAVAEESSN